jgi:kynurenine formamidase
MSEQDRIDDGHAAGRLESLGNKERLRGVSAVREGKCWMLGTEVFGPSPGPADPGRPTQLHIVYRDWSHYEKGLAEPLAGGVCSVDDGVLLNCHGGTHLDARGHIFADGKIAGGIPASSTVGGLQHGDVAAIGRLGVVCRGVLVDLCRQWDGAPLPRDHKVTLEELQACLDAQEVDVQPGDMLLLRTGNIRRFREEGPACFWREYSEPGLSDDDDLLAWIDDNWILGIGTDTLANERPVSPRTGAQYPLHRYLLRDRGLQFHEGLWLEEVAVDCAADGVYIGLYVAAPLKLVGASGSPVNPVFLK